jgi:hypothetical protein
MAAMERHCGSLRGNVSMYYITVYLEYLLGLSEMHKETVNKKVSY